MIIRGTTRVPLRPCHECSISSKEQRSKLARRFLALPLLWRVHREVVYLFLLVACIGLAADQDRHSKTETTTTTTPDRFLWARYPAAEVVFDAVKLRQLDHLVLVAGHAVLDPHTESLESADHLERVWHLMDYQRNQDLPKALVSHIQRGVQEAAKDAKALLIFSGGQTRPEAGPHDEGSSYYRVAEHYGWWGHASGAEGSDLSVAQRAVTEDFATDSFQNLLFSICRFYEVVGRYPARITVVGFSFKKHRFASLHRAAIRFPLERFSYIGIQPPRSSRFDLAKAELGEKRNSVVLFRADPYGCNTPSLLEKRLARNPFRRTNPYPLSCSAMRDLLQWCDAELFPLPLPWHNETAMVPGDVAGG